MTDKKKIILRRGSGVDLPGKPRAISPKQWNRSLDEGEMAYSEDDGRIFVGPKIGSNLPQSRRLQYPYRNIEVIGENSVEAFARMHGDRMREGDNRDYYETILTPGAALADLQPIAFIAANVVISSDIIVFNGRRLKTFVVDNGLIPIQGPSGKSIRLETPARYWRVRAGINGASTALTIMQSLFIREMGFHESIGGPNIISQATVISVAGGTDTSGEFVAGDLPSYATDGNINTTYYGRRPDFDASYPLRFPPEGIAFDFGAGNEKWIAEASFIWGASTYTDFPISIEYSDDKLNWVKAYRGVSYWPVAGQQRYIPERIDIAPNNLTRVIGFYGNRRSGASKVKIADIKLYAVVGGPPLTIWTPTTGFLTDSNNAWDDSILTEWQSPNNNTQISADFRLFTKSTVVQIKVTGPLNPIEAPIEMGFSWGEVGSNEGNLVYNNLTWTPNEVKTYDITIVNNVTNDALQLPLN